jgi:3-methyladenine DNA glycosylase AlkD
VTADPTAAAVVQDLQAHQDPSQVPLLRKRVAPDEDLIGMRMRDLFAVAKAHAALPLDEVAVLLEHPAYEPRMAAFCILDFQARRKLDEAERAALAACYLDHHDRITTWDMVDRSAPRVVGAHLADGPYDVLFDLARSDDPLRRRTAITAPLFFVMAGSDADVVEGFELAARLAADPDPLVHLPVGTFLKHAGARDADSVLRFLDEHEASMPRAAVRAARTKLPS